MLEDVYPDKPLDIRIVVPPTLGGRAVVDALAELAAITPSQARLVIQFGAVKINGSPCIRPSTKLKSQTRLTVSWRPVAGASRNVLTKVYEDDHFLVVDKPPGRPVQATRLGGGNSIVEELTAEAKSTWEPKVVHRLDLPVSGLLAVAKSTAAARALSASIKEGKVTKIYLALVCDSSRGRTFLSGAGEHPQAIDAPLKWLSGQARALVAPEGKRCLSHVLYAGDQQGACVVAVSLETGRTHQIRAHLAFAGLPVVGDRTYGGRGGHDANRIALHSAFLRVPHPVTDELLEFMQPPPAGFWTAAQCETPSRLPEHLVAAVRRMGV